MAAIAYLPARERLLVSANRLVFGARQAPDEVLRTFGSRMTRAVTTDELLLQLAESLRKTMALTSAEVRLTEESARSDVACCAVRFQWRGGAGGRGRQWISERDLNILRA